ncbi:MAG TPA: hypothetical protein VHX17_10590 [Candidatus Cybelea sp.]|nr:hypothetical protein [Candidatus Cybelea sp.]
MKPTVLFLSLVLLVAAAPPQPSPSPAPAPSPATSGLPSPGPSSPASRLSQAPVILIYPFDVQTGADPKIGIAIAQISAQEMASAGGLEVPAIPQGVKRTDFLEYARAQKADFYISGYVTPVGDTAAVVEQVVSVDSGVILFSQTAQVSSVADVASQSLLARSQILAFTGRGTQTVETQASSTPAPSSTNGANVPISGIGSIVDSVFKHKGGAHSGPSPAPTIKPSRGIIVAPVIAGTSFSSSDVAGATNELYYALGHFYNAQMTTVASAPAQSAETICGANRDNTIAAGTLQANPGAHHKLQYTLDLTIYTCFGAPLDHQVGKGGSYKAAVDAAVAAYATTHPENS